MPDKERLRVLLVEDSREDEELLRAELVRAGWSPEVRRIETAEAMRTALDGAEFDLILADWTLPRFSGLEALRLARERCVDVPFVIVSGTITDEMAVTAIKAGASDYVMKDKTSRLASAIRRELREIEAKKALRTSEELVRRSALRDSVTGLPNRILFEDRLRQALLRAEQAGHGDVALLAFEIEAFGGNGERIDSGELDELTRQLADRLVAALRSNDPIGRFGDRRFCVFAEQIRQPHAPVRLAVSLQDVIARPFTLGARSFAVRASVGVSMSSGPRTTVEDLLKDAMIALRRAVEAGPGGRVVFEASMHETARERLRLEADLKHAIERREFRLRYRPYVSLRDGGLTGFEALLRWQHPSRGVLRPAEFLCAAETSGLSVQIGSWTLAESCRQASVWNEIRTRSGPKSVGVGLTQRQFCDPDLERRVTAVLGQTGLDAPYLNFEIAERIVMADADGAIDALRALKSRKLRLHMDEFGSGFSSLTHLNRFPVDRIKIERSFTRTVGRDAADQKIVRALVKFAEALGLEVIAEGIDTVAQRKALADVGVHFGQGRVFAESLEPAEATRLVAAARGFFR